MRKVLLGGPRWPALAWRGCAMGAGGRGVHGHRRPRRGGLAPRAACGSAPAGQVRLAAMGRGGTGDPPRAAGGGVERGAAEHAAGDVPVDAVGRRRGSWTPGVSTLTGMNPIFEPVLAELSERHRDEVMSAFAAVEHSPEPVPEAQLLALRDATVRRSLDDLLHRVGRTLVPVGTSWTSGYRDEVAAELAQAGWHSLPAIDRAVLVLVLIHSVAIPRSRGTLQGDAWTSGQPTMASELLEASRLQPTDVRIALAHLRAAGRDRTERGLSARPATAPPQRGGPAAPHRRADPGRGTQQPGSRGDPDPARPAGSGMSTDLPRTRPEGSRGGHDIVGSRVLVGTQMVDISRLSTHPVPMISQGLITVAGQGPKDSNGAGKSSFIAGLSLLHADDQWKLASGAAGAADLLFTAELAAQETRYSNADHGYIIGVFAAPGAATIAELQESSLTVWLRINRKAPYLDLRWRDGLYVTYGTSEAQRAERVDAMWQSLPFSNGRTDFHASRLSAVLFGGNARCVSFLSTSVRSSPTPNLLAQPLNDLSAARIFDAIANLTGLDRELEQEQALRSKEYRHRRDVLDAERDLETWQREIAIVEAGIVQRRGARDQLGASRAAWQNRCARHLVDGLERADQIRSAIRDLDNRAEQLSGQLGEVDAQIDAMSDDVESARHLSEITRRREELSGRDKDLDASHQFTVHRLDDLSGQHRQLLELARAADGRTQEVAAQQWETAKEKLEQVLAGKGAAEAAEQRARDLRDAAESGQDLATDQLRVLEQAGVPAAALLDVVQLDAAERPAWEPGLALYRDAVVVHREQGAEARGLLASLPGSTLVLADKPARAAAEHPDLPASADPRFDLAVFLTAIG